MFPFSRFLFDKKNCFVHACVCGWNIYWNDIDLLYVYRLIIGLHIISSSEGRFTGEANYQHT